MNQGLHNQHIITLSEKEKFINATSEILEGEFHPSNPLLKLVGDYSKSVESGNLSEMVLYEVVHEKNQMRNAMFMHMMQPFWAGYNTELTTLGKKEKFIIFLKILREVKNVYPEETLVEIIHAMQLRLDITNEEGNMLVNGKMWHDYFLNGYHDYVFNVVKTDTKGFYW